MALLNLLHYFSCDSGHHLVFLSFALLLLPLTCGQIHGTLNSDLVKTPFPSVELERHGKFAKKGPFVIATSKTHKLCCFFLIAFFL